MLQKYSRYRILQEFFDFPRKSFQMREISRGVKLAQTSVMNHLRALEKEGLIRKERRNIYPSYTANREGNNFKLLKSQNIILRIHGCGLIGYLEEKMRPDSIVLFGSASRGEDTENSDIDIFIQARETKMDLKKYEHSLKREINIIFELKLNSLSKELKNNIINGRILYGYLKVF